MNLSCHIDKVLELVQEILHCLQDHHDKQSLLQAIKIINNIKNNIENGVETLKFDQSEDGNTVKCETYEQESFPIPKQPEENDNSEQVQESKPNEAPVKITICKSDKELSSKKLKKLKHNKEKSKRENFAINKDLNPLFDNNTCKVCCTKFTITEMEDHHLTHCIDELYSCPYCNYNSDDITGLVEHVTITHGFRYNCNHCDFNSRFISAVKKHSILEHGETHTNPLQCFFCKKLVETVGKLRSHIEGTHNSNPQTCNTCEKQFVNLTGLRSHIYHAHTEREGYTCESCGAKFSAKHTLKLHVEREHNTSVEVHPCSKCNKTFNSQIFLKRHMESHKEKTFMCNCCDYKCRRLGNLKRHIEDVHSTERNFHCTYCDYSAKNIIYLKKHIKIVHTEAHIRNYKCKYCGKTFKQSSKLVVHEKIHTGEYGGHCSICNKNFVQSYNHRIHMMKQHSMKV